MPVNSEETIEGPEITSAKDRLRVFGQEGHVCRCGPDYIERLAEGRLPIDVFAVADIATMEQLERIAYPVEGLFSVANRS